VSGKLGLGTMPCQQVRDALSDYREGGLPPPARQGVAAHLSECEACAREERQLATLLTVIRERIPPREPSLDIWAELEPKVAAHMAEERMNLLKRAQVRLGRFLSSVAAGAILFTQALAMNTEAKLKKYLITDPYTLADEEG
jgi:anti-sigma factor RsiW